MRKILLVLFLSLFTLPVLAENTILIIGDSISEGYGFDPKQGWVALLQNRLQMEHYPYQVKNISITGDTTSDGLERLPAALARYQPKITLLALGNNDGLRGIQLTAVKTNLQQIILLLQQAQSQILLLSGQLPANYGITYIQKFKQMYVELAGQNHVPVVTNFLNGVSENPKLIQADGIHPTAQAQQIILNNVWGELKKMLKK